FDDREFGGDEKAIRQHEDEGKDQIPGFHVGCGCGVYLEPSSCGAVGQWSGGARGPAGSDSRNLESKPAPRLHYSPAPHTSPSVFQNRGYDFDTTCSCAIVTPPRARPAIAKAIAIRWSLCVSTTAGSPLQPGWMTSASSFSSTETPR